MRKLPTLTAPLRSRRVYVIGRSIGAVSINSVGKGDDVSVFCLGIVSWGHRLRADSLLAFCFSWLRIRLSKASGFHDVRGQQLLFCIQEILSFQESVLF